MADGVPAAKSFITGSRAYGTPRDDSDIDLVVFTDAETYTVLNNLSDCVAANEKADYPHVRFGRLNIIPCSCMETYNAWLRGTERLKLEAPATRERAVEVIKEELELERK